MPEFDLVGDVSFCPPERNALADFFERAKGGEWTSSKDWRKEYTPHCEWYRVGCDESNTTTRSLKLRNNGLSGVLSPLISNLTNLVHLDISDNDVKVRLWCLHLQ